MSLELSRRLAATALGSLLAVQAASGCRGEKQTLPPPGGDEATLAYGYGPDLNGSAKYQPDVVIVHGGPRAIRSASADGLVWTIDGQAPGAKALREGDVMFVTSRAVGRVVRIERAGDDLAVTLAPVGLTEVIREADISITRELTAEAVIYQEIPDLPGKMSIPPPLSSSAPSRPSVSYAAYRGQPSTPAVRYLPEPAFAAAFGGGGGRMPPPQKTSFKASVGAWEVEPYLKTQEKPGVGRSQKFGLKVQRKFGAMKGTSGPADVGTGLKAGIDAGFFARDLKLQARVPIRDGKVGETTFLIDGIEELAVSIAAGVEKGITDNERIRVEIPIEITAQIPPGPATGGVPMVAQLKFKFIVSTAFSASNSTINATGRYGLRGPMGYAKGSMVAPAFEVMAPLVPSIGGVSVGASGLVFAFEVRSLVGVGIPAGMAGPYVKLVTSLGISRGSDLGLIKCRGATLKMDVGGGVGTQVSLPVAGVLEKLLGQKAKVEMELGEVLKTVFNRSVVSPDVPLCGGTGGGGGG